MARFTFQPYIQETREKLKDGAIEMTCPSLLDSITEDTEFEDLPVYKEYVSKFDVVNDLKNIGIVGLNVPSDLEDVFDFTLLVQLVASSSSSEYELELDAETPMANLIITAQSITTKLQELWSLQIFRLFEFYIREQLNQEGLRLRSEIDREAVDRKRKVLLLEYRKKIIRLKYQLQCEQEINVIDAELEELLM